MKLIYKKTLSVALSKLNKYSAKKLTEKDIVDPFGKQNADQLIASFDNAQAKEHPSVKAQESEYNSALSDIKVNKASRYPSINLEGSATHRDRSIAVTMSWDFYNKSSDYSVKKSHAVALSAKSRSDELLRGYSRTCGNGKSGYETERTPCQNCETVDCNTIKSGKRL